MNTEVDINSGKFSGVGCLLIAIAIVLMGLGCAVAEKIRAGQPIVIIQHVDSR